MTLLGLEQQIAALMSGYPERGVALQGRYPLRQCLSSQSPDLPLPHCLAPSLIFFSLPFWFSLPLFLFKEFLAILSVFPFFLKDVGDLASRRNPCLFGGFPCCFPKRQGEEDQGILSGSGRERGLWRRGLFRKVHLLEILENLETLEKPEAVENKGDSDLIPILANRFADSCESLNSRESFQGSRTEPLFCESRFGGLTLTIANRRLEAIRANRSHFMKEFFFVRIDSRESPRFALRIAGPSKFIVLLSVFHLFPNNFGGSAEKTNPCLFGGFPCLFPKQQGKADLVPL